MGERITLKRHIYTQSEIETEYRKGTPSKLTYGDIIKARCRCSRQKAWRILTTYLPILKFLVEYDFKHYIVGDLLAGLSVSFMHLPQGMGFGVLAGLQPVYGLYTTFFPILFYLLFGTSPHISFGTNAVLALFTQNVVDREVEYYRQSLANANATVDKVSTLIDTATGYMTIATNESVYSNFTSSAANISTNESVYSNYTSSAASISTNESVYSNYTSSAASISTNESIYSNYTSSAANNSTTWANSINSSILSNSNYSSRVTTIPNVPADTISNVTSLNYTNSFTRNFSNISSFSVHDSINFTFNSTENFYSRILNATTDFLSISNITELFENSSWVTETLSPIPSTIADEDLLKVKVGAAMTSSLIVGTILGGMGILRLGFLTRYLSVSFIGGFTTGAAIHIASSQVPKAFGIAVGSHSGAGRLVKMYIELFSNISKIKVPEVIIALICMIVLTVVKVCINERFKKQMKIPIPIDLLVVVVGTIASHFGKFEEQFDVVVVGDIPSGIPMPKVPSLDSAYRIATDCVVMAVLSFAMSISMAKLTASLNGIKIHDNQELIAYGVSNIGSSFFSCFPQATAPPRTMILNSLGSKTTLNAVPTAIFMVLVLLWIGRLFVSLPMSVLAAMIIVSMKDLLLQFTEVPRYWRINKYDGMIWLITCAVSVFVDLDYGIISGVGVSIFFVVVQHQLATGRLLGQSETEDIIIDIKYRNRLLEYPGIKIFQFQAPLYFANAERFKSQLNQLVVNPLKIRKAQRLYGPIIQIDIPSPNVKSLEINGKASQFNRESNRTFSQRRNYLKKLSKEVPHHIVIDCQMISHIDLAGVNMLQLIVKEYKDIDVTVFLAKCPKRMLTVLESAQFFEKFPKEHVFFDVVDAVEIAAHSESGEEESHNTSEEKPSRSGSAIPFNDRNKRVAQKEAINSNAAKATPDSDDEVTKL